MNGLFLRAENVRTSACRTQTNNWQLMWKPDHWWAEPRRAPACLLALYVAQSNAAAGCLTPARRSSAHGERRRGEGSPAGPGKTHSDGGGGGGSADWEGSPLPSVSQPFA